MLLRSLRIPSVLTVTFRLSPSADSFLDSFLFMFSLAKNWLAVNHAMLFANILYQSFCRCIAGTSSNHILSATPRTESARGSKRCFNIVFNRVNFRCCPILKQAEASVQHCNFFPDFTFLCRHRISDIFLERCSTSCSAELPIRLRTFCIASSLAISGATVSLAHSSIISKDFDQKALEPFLSPWTLLTY